MPFLYNLNYLSDNPTDRVQSNNVFLIEPDWITKYANYPLIVFSTIIPFWEINRTSCSCSLGRQMSIRLPAWNIFYSVVEEMSNRLIYFPITVILLKTLKL